MIVRLLQSLINGNRSEIIQQGAIEENKKKEPKLVDVAEQALRNKSAMHSEELDGIVKYGWPKFRRKRFKNQTRRKVWDVLCNALGAPDNNMADEITEKIVEVAEVDNFYQEIFDKEKEE